MSPHWRSLLDETWTVWAFECAANFVYFSQFTEQEKKLMEATTEFNQKVTAVL